MGSVRAGEFEGLVQKSLAGVGVNHVVVGGFIDRVDSPPVDQRRGEEFSGDLPGP